jgi:cysteine-rich repeat protein
MFDILKKFPLFAFLILINSCDADDLTYGYCGNGELNKGEECDKGFANSDLVADACRSDCTKPYCGDGIKDSEEEWEGFQLDQKTCSLLGYDRGQLSCNDDCTFDYSLCSVCGNGTAEGGEDCDLNDVGGVDCYAFGFDSGELECNFDCTYDFSACINGCQNNIVDPGEQCDGTAEIEFDCVEAGFEGGVVRCSSVCQYDFSGCNLGCGNGLIDPGESCDDGNDIKEDGCHNCQKSSGNYQVFIDKTFPWQPVDLAVDDFDGDGIRDLLVATLAADHVSGSLSLILSSNPETAITLISNPVIKCTSFKHDSLLPAGIVAASLTSDGTVIYSYSPDYNTQFEEISSSEVPYSFTAIDIDRDGEEEVVFSANPSQKIMAFRYSEPALLDLITLGGQPGDLGAFEFNTDGFADIAIVRRASQMVAVILGLGEDQFSYHTARYLGGTPGDMQIADLDGDGYKDIIVTDLLEPYFYVYFGLAEGLSYRSQFGLSEKAFQIKTAHLNDDGFLDLVLLFPVSGIVSTFLGTADLSFSESFSWNECSSPLALSTKDVNGDGLSDLTFICGGDKRVVSLVAIPEQVIK